VSVKGLDQFLKCLVCLAHSFAPHQSHLRLVSTTSPL
jgi:hypothetical protein